MSYPSRDLLLVPRYKIYMKIEFYQYRRRRRLREDDVVFGEDDVVFAEDDVVFDRRRRRFRRRRHRPVRNRPIKKPKIVNY